MVAVKHSAPQQERDATAGHATADRHGTVRPTPRPYPLFLDIVRRVAASDADLARQILAGVEVYGAAERRPRVDRPVLSRRGRVTLRDCGQGSSATTVILVPSLINPSAILDLAPGNSLCEHLAGQGFRPLLVDWGTPAPEHRDEGLAAHVHDYLVPLIASLDQPVHLVGYCLGGTLAMAARDALPLKSLTLLATPWHFDRYDTAAQVAALELWQGSEAAVDPLGLVPMELFQTLFWALDEARTARKFAALWQRRDDADHVAAFVTLEDWANGGAPLTLAAAREILLDLMQGRYPRDLCDATGKPPVNGRSTLPCRHFTATNDAIAPAATAPDNVPAIACPSGHVGMVAGRNAVDGMWRPLTNWLSDVERMP